jgi:outer membrane lipoprotein-sorting protein
MNYKRRLKPFEVVNKSRTDVLLQVLYVTRLSSLCGRLFQVAVLGVCCFVFFLLPCCTHLKTPLSVPPQQSCSGQEILLKVRETGAPQGLKGVAKVKVTTADEKFSVKELIVAQRPNLLRLETLTPLGHPQFFAVANGDALYLFAPSENTFYYGNTSQKNMSSFLPLNLSLENVVPLLLGGVPLINYDTEHVGCQVLGDCYSLQLWAEDENTRQVLTVGFEDLTIMASEIYHNREELYFSAKFEDYEMTGEVLFPKKITVYMPRDNTTVTIKYKQLEFLAEIDPAEFMLTAPQGAEVVHLQ